MGHKEVGAQSHAAVELGAELRRLRVAHGLSQRAQAKALYLSSHSTVADYEQGRRVPPAETIARYEAQFGLVDGELVRLRERVLEDRAAREVDDLRARAAVGAEDVAGTADDIAGNVVGVVDSSAEAVGEGSGEAAKNSMVKGDDPVPPRWRRSLWWIAALGALVLVLGAALWWRSSDKALGMVWSPHATRILPLPTTPAQPQQDGSDPARAGCSQGTVETLAAQEIVIGRDVLGTLELRYSTACRTGWPRFMPTGALIYNKSPGIRIFLEVARPADGVASRVDEAFLHDSHWAGMLSTADGCLVARGAVLIDGKLSEIGETPCTAPPR
ncbi:helix-turn-helix domain-containing protein [Nonomuraea sp. NPDC004702]